MNYDYSRCPKSKCSVWKTEQNLVQISDVRTVWLVQSLGCTINVRNPNKFERSVSRVDQPNVRNQNKIVWISVVIQNPNDSTTEPKQKALKSESACFNRSKIIATQSYGGIFLLKLACFSDGRSEIQIFIIFVWFEKLLFFIGKGQRI